MHFFLCHVQSFDNYLAAILLEIWWLEPSILNLLPLVTSALRSHISIFSPLTEVLEVLILMVNHLSSLSTGFYGHSIFRFGEFIGSKLITFFEDWPKRFQIGEKFCDIMSLMLEQTGSFEKIP